MKMTKQALRDTTAKLVEAVTNGDTERQAEMEQLILDMAERDRRHEQSLDSVVEYHRLTGVHIGNCIGGAVTYVSAFETLSGKLDKETTERLETAINAACTDLDNATKNNLQLCFVLSTVLHVLSRHMVRRTEDMIKDDQIKQVAAMLGMETVPDAAELSTVIGLAAGICHRVYEEGEKNRNG